MPRENLERLREALARLPTASRADLKAEWHRLYRTEAPARLEAYPVKNVYVEASGPGD